MPSCSYRCLANHVSHVTLFREHSDAMPLNNYGRRLTQELTPLNDKRHVATSDDSFKALNFKNVTDSHLMRSLMYISDARNERNVRLMNKVQEFRVSQVISNLCSPKIFSIPISRQIFAVLCYQYSSVFGRSLTC